MRVPNSLVYRLLTILFFFLAVMLGLVPRPSLAQTNETATTTSGGNWTNTSTWNCTNNPCFPNNGPSFVYDVFINGGGLLLNSSSTPTSITVDTLSIASSASLTLENGATVGTNAPVSNNGTVTVGNGSGGALAVAGTLTNNGSIIVNTGSVSANDATADVINNGSIQVSGGATLDAGQDAINNGSLNLSGNSALNAGRDVVDNGILNISDSTVSAGRNVTVNSGTLSVSGGGQVTVGAGGTFSSSSGANVIVNGGSALSLITTSGPAQSMLTGNYTLTGNTGGAAIEYGSGGITQIGDGTNSSQLTLNGANAFMELSGQTGSNSALGGLAMIANNASLTLENGATVASFGTLTNNGSLTANKGSVTVNGAAADVINNGSIQVSGGALTAGQDVINNSTLDISGGSALNAGRDVVDNGTLDISGGSVVTVGRNVTVNNGTMSLSGGSQIITGAGGILSLVNGTVQGNGTVSTGIGGTTAMAMTGGTLVPGLLPAVPGTLTINGNFTQDGGIFEELIGSTGIGGNGLLQVNGGVSLNPNLGDNASLDIAFVSGFTLSANDSFDIINYLAIPGLAGTFANAPMSGFAADGWNWSINYAGGVNTNEVVITALTPIGATPEPGTIFLLGTALLGLALHIHITKGAKHVEASN